MDTDEPSNVTMPTWPAWVMLATMAACTYPALTASAPSVRAQTVQAGASATAALR